MKELHASNCTCMTCLVTRARTIALEEAPYLTDEDVAKFVAAQAGRRPRFDLRLEDEAIRRTVALMRELGVLQYDGIVLGPPPPPPPCVLTDDERKKRDEARAEADRNDLFAASGYAPR